MIVADFCGALGRIIKEENKNEFYIDGLHLTPKGNESMLNIIGAQEQLSFIKRNDY